MGPLITGVRLLFGSEPRLQSGARAMHRRPRSLNRRLVVGERGGCGSRETPTRSIGGGRRTQRAPVVSELAAQAYSCRCLSRAPQVGNSGRVMVERLSRGSCSRLLCMSEQPNNLIQRTPTTTVLVSPRPGPCELQCFTIQRRLAHLRPRASRRAIHDVLSRPAV